MSKPVNSYWTDEQWRAIEESGNNIIVSAGAGSGKTAVLTERVIYKLKHGVNINDLIVLTFTNAAAKEMKDRIRESIKKDSSLANQLALLDSSNITTFDAFSLSIVKKYHYLLNLSNHINIVDDVYLQINKDKILDDLFLEMYNKEDFRHFIDTFTNKDDVPIKNMINEINNKISGICDKDSFYNHIIDIDLVINDYITFIKENVNVILDLLNEIIDNVNDEKILDYARELTDIFSIDTNNYDSVLTLKNLKFKSFPRSKDINDLEKEFSKNIIDKVKTYYSEINENINYSSIEEVKKELLESANYTKIIIGILREYNNRIFDFKVKNNCFDFNDILFLSIKILKENKEILDEIKNNTNEIMVDEFQDTNDNNEYFLSLISNNNLYMVGDVKQSIYKFRNANAKIFTNTYYKYKNGEGITIDLNKNFRSRKEVLESINLIFEHIMDYNIGGVDYDDFQKLKFGNTNYQDNGYNNYLEILNYSYDEYKENFTKEEVEIFAIIDDINNKIKNNYQVFDIKKKEFRNIAYKDFVILLDRKTSFDVYKKIFEYKNIPLILYKDESFSYNSVIFVLRNILNAINCFYTNDFSLFNYSLVSITRSYLCEFSDELIFKNINSLENTKEFENVVDKIKYLESYYEKHSLKELLLEIYKTFDMYMATIKIANIKENNIKLDYLVSVAGNLESLGYDLKDFVAYFDKLFESGIDIKYSKEKDSGNAVSIMSIHSSKGLEFPICYFASLYKKFNVRDVNSNFLYDNKYKIISPVFNEGIKNTILKNLVKKNYFKEDVEEKIRLFYVALTRAKEKMIMVCNINDISNFNLPYDKVVNDLERLEYRSFLDMLLSIKKFLIPFIKEIKVTPSKDYELLKTTNYEDKIDQIYKEYDYKSINIKLEEKEKINYSSTYDITNYTDMNIGIKIHEVLEYLDFNNYKEDIKKYNLSDYLKVKILNLFKMPFMKEYINIYKEYEFVDEEEGIIDLLIECDNKFIVVDYKMKEINKDRYINQVKKYINFVKKITDKKVEGYIYSIIDCEYIKVDEI